MLVRTMAVEPEHKFQTPVTTSKISYSAVSSKIYDLSEICVLQGTNNY